MKVTVAKTAGFCFGVQRALDIVYENIGEGKNPIYTYGPIIHNSHVVAELKEKGVSVIDSRRELDELAAGTVIIRSHGVSKDVYESLERPGIDRVNATCPFVARIHRIVEKASAEGRHVIIAGDRDHPEVRGIMGWCENCCTVVRTASDLAGFSAEKGTKITLAAQTTFNYSEFKDIVEFSKKLGYDISVANTICDATQKRQEEARSISQLVDAMIVIGDMHSSNTQKLYEICKQFCKRTYLIETLDDLKPVNFQSPGHIGITAGASTPKKIIEEVQNYVRNEF